MADVMLENDSLRVVIRPQLGGGIARCDVHIGGDWHAVMRPAPVTNWFNDLACYVLAPWSNRIRDAELAWDGKTIALQSDWKDGTAIHGDVKSAAFIILDRSPQSVRMRLVRDGVAGQNWPWKYECEVRYQVDGTTLTANLIVRNVDDTSMPCGLGLHPFFMTRINSALASVRLAVAGRYPCEGMMPVGKATDESLCASLRGGWPVAGGLDDVFALNAPEFETQVSWPGELEMRMTATGGCGHAVIYSGEAGCEPSFFCLEPVTHVNDGMNLLAKGWDGTGVRILQPGEAMQLNTVFEFQRL